jgi:hypothetical protein
MANKKHEKSIMALKKFALQILFAIFCSLVNFLKKNRALLRHKILSLLLISCHKMKYSFQISSVSSFLPPSTQCYFRTCFKSILDKKGNYEMAETRNINRFFEAKPSPFELSEIVIEIFVTLLEI